MALPVRWLGVRLGVVILPEQRWPRAWRTWQGVEGLGVDHLWTYDHLAWRTLRDDPWFGAVPLLAAVATVTSRVRLGLLVSSPNFRHPVPFAREVLTLDDLTLGRITVGLGAGGVGWDATVLGNEPWSRPERTERFEEFVDLLDALLREPAVTVRGRHYSAVEARSVPGCVQQPRVPFAIAATGPRGMRLAARQGHCWVTTGPPGAEQLRTPAASVALRDQVKAVEAACEKAGRDPATLDRLVLTGVEVASALGSADELLDQLGQFEAAGMTDVVIHWPRATEPYCGDPAHVAAVVSDVMGELTRTRT